MLADRLGTLATVAYIAARSAIHRSEVLSGVEALSSSRHAGRSGLTAYRAQIARTMSHCERNLV
jgi:hypothetical protein